MTASQHASRAPLAALLALALAGCSLFGDDEALKPAELVKFDRSLEVRRVWSVKLGDGAEIPLAGLRPTLVGGRVYAASADGRVHAIDPETGTLAWSLDLDLRLGAGPGVGSDVVVVGSLDGTVVAIDETTGAERWRTSVSSEVLSSPAAADDVVVARSQDGRVYALDATSGERLWVYDQSVPALSLRGTGEPLLHAGFAYLGFDNGRVSALRLDDGSVVWEQTVSAPQGRTELERIVDVDGAMLMVASDLYAVTYQGLLAALTAGSGRILWVKDMSSAGGVDVSRTQLTVADDEDAVWVVDRLSGGTLWKQDQLIRRNVTGPVFHGDNIVVGDFEGYLHWMAEDDGRFVARERAGSERLVARPLGAGNLLLVQTQEGRLVAYRIVT